MPDEDLIEIDRHLAATGTTTTSGSSTFCTCIRRFFPLFFLLLISTIVSSSETSQSGAGISRSNHQLLRSRNVNELHPRQSTDYGMENPDFRSSSAVVSSRVNDTGDAIAALRRYPSQPPLRARDTLFKTKNKRKRGRQEVAPEEVDPEVNFPRPYRHRSRSSSSSSSSSSAAAALFLQASKDSMRGDKMLKSSKDALIVTKKSYLKKDWCKTEPLIQRVREAGCVTRTVVNRFCYGQCNSFYIPKNAVPVNSASGTSSDQLDQTSFKSCAFCKPKRFSWITITLNCPGRIPPFKKKRIQRIKKCKCISEILS